jgi:hypothetical protein
VNSELLIRLGVSGCTILVTISSQHLNPLLPCEAPAAISKFALHVHVEPRPAVERMQHRTWQIEVRLLAVDASGKNLNVANGTRGWHIPDDRLAKQTGRQRSLRAFSSQSVIASQPLLAQPTHAILSTIVATHPRKCQNKFAHLQNLRMPVLMRLSSWICATASTSQFAPVFATLDFC